ncbi:uncharacterized protein BJ212DRAFT_346761 [Suillus subaureus]|uniref:Uncharacterized protein n=1 Tax=Suillus subaureus TaxID=48587 RepID=A0A9P7E8T4_9AGAM|nr:uncharacterized protein BJ212DRAFT_346761 [Suillus subaureus]KAG1814682.1 hypothetical protein BJ212DRAFT_346761 [Suillus subaureus]
MLCTSDLTPSPRFLPTTSNPHSIHNELDPRLYSQHVRFSLSLGIAQTLVEKILFGTDRFTNLKNKDSKYVDEGVQSMFQPNHESTQRDRWVGCEGGWPAGRVHKRADRLLCDAYHDLRIAVTVQEGVPVVGGKRKAQQHVGCRAAKVDEQKEALTARSGTGGGKELCRGRCIGHACVIGCGQTMDRLGYRQHTRCYRRILKCYQPRTGSKACER